MQEDLLAALAGLLRPARRILAFTGAGISTRSNIPDYRGPAGVYRDRSPVYYQDFITSDSARREYWSFKVDGYVAFRDARPNSAHHALVELDARGQLALVVTQNVDGLHQLSGLARDRLVELHGNNREVECDTCGLREDPERCMTHFSETGEPPGCLSCGGFMKPAVVMFGQPLASENLQKAHVASQAADLVLALGSSLVVTPAADIPLVGVRNGVRYVIINQGQTPHDHLATLRIDGDVADYLPAAVSRL